MEYFLFIGFNFNIANKDYDGLNQTSYYINIFPRVFVPYKSYFGFNLIAQVSNKSTNKREQLLFEKPWLDTFYCKWFLKKTHWQ